MLMAAAYSLDLRQKILQALERGVGSQRQIAELFGVSQSFVEKLLQRVRRTGQAAAKRQGGKRPARLDLAARERVRQWVQEQPDLTLEELADRLYDTARIRVGVSTLCRVLQQLDLPRKKSRSMRPSAIPNPSAKPAAPIKPNWPGAPSSG
jgi:transposase